MINITIVITMTIVGSVAPRGEGIHNKVHSYHWYYDY